MGPFRIDIFNGKVLHADFNLHRILSGQESHLNILKFLMGANPLFSTNFWGLFGVRCAFQHFTSEPRETQSRNSLETQQWPAKHCVQPTPFSPPSSLRHLLRRGYEGQEGFDRQAGLAWAGVAQRRPPQRLFQEFPAKSKFLAVPCPFARGPHFETFVILPDRQTPRSRL